MKTPDDIRVLQAACGALEQSTSVRMLVANLTFLWDRYVTHPPDGAWWCNPRAVNPNAKATVPHA